MNKKIKLILLLLLILVLVVTVKTTLKKQTENKKGDSEPNELSEYIPLEEITDEQERQTTISIYYKNKKTGELFPEDKKIDTKDLLNNPYKFLLEQMMLDAKDENLESVIPNGVKINNVEIKGRIVEIDFSKEFIEKHIGGKENEEKTIEGIIKTLSCLNEVEGIRIKIEGRENGQFQDKQINFKNIFYVEQYIK